MNGFQVDASGLGGLLAWLLSRPEAKAQEMDRERMSQFYRDIIGEESQYRSGLANILSGQPTVERTPVFQGEIPSARSLGGATERIVSPGVDVNDPMAMERALTTLQVGRKFPELPQFESKLAPELTEKAMKMIPDVGAKLEERIERRAEKRFGTEESIWSDTIKDDRDYIRKLMPYMDEAEMRELMEAADKPGGILGHPRSGAIARGALDRKFQQELDQLFEKEKTRAKFKKGKGKGGEDRERRLMTPDQIRKAGEGITGDFEDYLINMTNINPTMLKTGVTRNTPLPNSSLLYVPGRMETYGDVEDTIVDMKSFAQKQFLDNIQTYEGDDVSALTDTYLPVSDVMMDFRNGNAERALEKIDYLMGQTRGREGKPSGAEVQSEKFRQELELELKNAPPPEEEKSGGITDFIKEQYERFTTPKQQAK